MACHGCQTGGGTLRPLLKVSLFFVCVCPLAGSLAQLSTAPKAVEIGVRHPRMGHGRNPLVVEVLSLGTYGISKCGFGGHSLAFPQSLVLTTKQMDQALLPILQMGKW